MQDNKISAMIIGLGNIGLNYDIGSNNNYLTHARSIIKSSNFKLKCGVDKNLKQIKKFTKIYKIPSYSNYETALKFHKPEFVAISTKDSSHYYILKKLCTYSFIKYILLEKPGGEDYHQMVKSFDLCEKKNVILFVNYFRNFLPYFINLAKKLKNRKVKFFIKYTRGIRNNASHIIAFLLMLNSKIDIKKIKVTYCKNNKLYKNENFNFKLDFKNISAHFFALKIKKLSITKVDIYSEQSCYYSDNSFIEMDYFTKDNSKLIKDSFEYNFLRQEKNTYKNKVQLVFYDNFYNILKNYKKYKNISLNSSKVLDLIINH